MKGQVKPVNLFFRVVGAWYYHELSDWFFEPPHRIDLTSKLYSPDFEIRDVALWNHFSGAILSAKEGGLEPALAKAFMMDLLSICRNPLGPYMGSNDKRIGEASRLLLCLPEEELSEVVSYLLNHPNDPDLFKKSFYLLSKLPPGTMKRHTAQMCQRCGSI